MNKILDQEQLDNTLLDLSCCATLLYVVNTYLGNAIGQKAANEACDALYMVHGLLKQIVNDFQDAVDNAPTAERKGKS